MLNSCLFKKNNLRGLKIRKRNLKIQKINKGMLFLNFGKSGIVVS